MVQKSSEEFKQWTEISQFIVFFVLFWFWKSEGKNRNITNFIFFPKENQEYY